MNPVNTFSAARWSFAASAASRTGTFASGCSSEVFIAYVLKRAPSEKMNSTGTNEVQCDGPSGVASTSTVNSRPSMYSSTKSSGYSGSVPITFAPSSSTLRTKECSSMPRLSPAHDGFTKSGKKSVLVTRGMSSRLSMMSYAGMRTPVLCATYFMSSFAGW